jgi:hypothetical protein
VQPNLLLIEIIKKAHRHDPTWFRRFDAACCEDANAAFIRALREEFKAGTINGDQLISLCYYLPWDVGLTRDPAAIGTDSVGKDILKAINTYFDIELGRGGFRSPPSPKEPAPEGHEPETPPVVEVP